MNLIQQFPDTTIGIRDKFKLPKKDYPWKNVNAQQTNVRDKSMAKFYDNEFLKWHIKLIFIILLGATSLSFIILNVSWLFLADH